MSLYSISSDFKETIDVNQILKTTYLLFSFIVGRTVPDRFYCQFVI